MEARHPHIFGEEDGVMEEERWEDIKAAERMAAGTTGALDGVALALPALMRAQKLQSRAARHGFDWPDLDGPRSKVFEEIAELDEASIENIEEEAGDFLFAAVNLVRAYRIDAEAALRAANAKFERRFRAMEDLAGGDFSERNLEAQESLWQEVKRREKSTS
jgi:ATP diphosphatase